VTRRVYRRLAPQRQRTRCRGFASEYGPCGSECCESCHPGRDPEDINDGDDHAFDLSRDEPDEGPDDYSEFDDYDPRGEP